MGKGWARATVTDQTQTGKQLMQTWRERKDKGAVPKWDKEGERLTIILGAQPAPRGYTPGIYPG